MVINSETDFDYNHDWNINVHSGLMVRDVNGIEYLVTKYHSEHNGMKYWTIRWLEGQYKDIEQIFTEHAILLDAYRP